MLYNGDGKWTAPIRFAELIEDHERLGRFSIDFEYFKIAENEYTKEDLLRIKNIVSTLFLAESYYNIDLLKEELLNLFDKESDKVAVSLFLNWFKQLSEHGRIDSVDYKSLEKIYSNREEVKEMLIASLEKEKKAIFQKGKEERNIEIAKKMIREGLEIAFISKITGLSEEEILKLKAEL